MIKYETNSKLIKEGQTFIAIKGHTVDGHDFIEEAIRNGAKKIITEKKLNIDIPYEIVQSTEDYLKNNLKEEYAHLFSTMKLIGVTGTNGKTTICYLTYQLLKLLNKKVAYIGTIGFYYNEEHKKISNTTPDILSLYKMLLEAKENDIDYIIMEVSSHALDLERIYGLKFKIGVFTNLTQDHLDYHKTIDNYLDAKKRILEYIDGNGIMIVNSDDKYADYFKNDKCYSVGFSGDYKIISSEYNPSHTHIEFLFKNKTYQVQTNLISTFNVYNYLMSLAIVNNLGFNIEDTITITKDVYSPKGRCETIKVGKGYAVIDYAHTPDAVQKIIKAYLEINHGRIITIIGCGGDRDRSKRPIMGCVATSLSDYVIFTSDNPRTEDANQIIADIIKDNAGNNYEIITDRKEALYKGLDMIEENDFLLILGKGHEDYQIIGREKHHFSEVEIINEYKTQNNL